MDYVEPQPDLTDPIEVMARAMWRGPLPLDSHECRQFARLAIAGLEECGFAVVPMEPMIADIAEAYEAGREEVRCIVSNHFARLTPAPHCEKETGDVATD